MTNRRAHSLKQTYVVVYQSLEGVRNEKAPLKKYYEHLIRFYEGKLPIVSPVSNLTWVHEKVEWLREGNSVIEIGCGDGEFARTALSQICQERGHIPQEMHITDFATGVLRVARRKINEELKYIKVHKLPIMVKTCIADVESLGENAFLRGKSFDRMIAINVFGDTEVDKAFKQAHSMLKKGGQLCCTLYSKETYDKFWGENGRGSYIAEQGIWFTPVDFYPLGTGLRAMATLVISDEYGAERRIPYVRLQRYDTREGWARVLEEAGFNIIKEPKEIIYTKEFVLSRWGQNLNATQRKLIDEWGGLPEVWEFTVIKK